MTMPQLCDHDEPCGCYVEGYAAGPAMPTGGGRTELRR